MKERLDVLLVQRNLAPSREKAKALIMSGIVYVDGQKEDKAGTQFDEAAAIEVRGSTLKYVSRGGLKLEKAMTHFGVEPAGKVCMDVGASTGGFTDCMLQNSCTLANGRFVKPFDRELVDRLAEWHKVIVTLEENVLQGGYGLPVTAYIHEHYPHRRVLNIGIPDAYVEHGNVSVLREGLGIDSDSIIKTMKSRGYLD